jgi:hypothetical protein
MKSAFSARHLNTASILVGAGVIGACLIIWAYVIHTHGVDVPREDQWHVPAHQIELFLDGRLTLDDLLVQHLESRKLVPNLISVGVVYLRGHFDTHAELYVGFIVGATLVCLIGVLAWLTWRRLDYALALAALFCAVLYSGHSIRFHLFSITFSACCRN